MTKCFYHSADLDGHCSGAIVDLYHDPDDHLELRGINYGDEFPWDTIQPGEKVYMVDFSLQPFEDMIRLASMCHLIWIDHHKSAIEDYQTSQCPPIEGKRSKGLAGCELTWMYFHGTTYLPYPVYLLGRYDVWDHKDENVLPFQYGMRMEETKLERNGVRRLWEALIGGFTQIDYERLVQTILNRGRDILHYQAVQNERLARSAAFETEIDGLRVIACNALMANSKLFDAVYDPQRHDAMLTFGWRKGCWKVSLYSEEPDVDVAKVAKARGGGGHAGAAGFQCQTLPFLPWS